MNSTSKENPTINDDNLAESSNMNRKNVKTSNRDLTSIADTIGQVELIALAPDEGKVSKNKSSEVEVPLASAAPDFDNIYNELHSKFPKIINLQEPVLLAVGIRKEMVKTTGISGMILKRWIAWYFRKSQYYKAHKEGAKRYNLHGDEAGVVTEKHCEKMAKQLEKIKKYEGNQHLETIKNNSNLT